ncbi:MAG: arginine--tRNA ligase, partial [Spirochaetales bacterium]|nr:arginine--tRNA ligase [Spirochaetales bacterium]
MKEIRAEWKGRVFAALQDMAAKRNVEIAPDAVVLERPPRPELGDIAIPVFPFAKIFKAAPLKIAEELAAALEADPGARSARFVPAGPYLNIHLPRSGAMKKILDRILAGEDACGHSDILVGRKIMIEFSSPNTNKPLHLGHLRNDALGESLARILKSAGAQVRCVDLINDRGIHICKS